MIKTILFGACGKMGRVIGKALIDALDIELVGAIDPYFKGEKYEKIIGTDKISLEVLGSIEELKEDFDVAVDFTNAEAAYQYKKDFTDGKKNGGRNYRTYSGDDK